MGGLIIVGSHVQKTTEQLNCLLDGIADLCEIPFNSNLVLQQNGLAAETERVAGLVNACVREGRTALVYTCRDRLRVECANKEELLKYSVMISKALASVVNRMQTRPRYLIAKGGITSSDVATEGLGIHRAMVLGQIRPGIPVWLAGSESKFQSLPYVIFPGNVGEKNTLKDIVRELS